MTGLGVVFRRSRRLCRLLLSCALGPALILICAEVADAETPGSYGVLSATSSSWEWFPPTGASIPGRHDKLGLPPADRASLRDVFTPEGLAIDDRVVAPSGLIVLPMISDNSHAQIEFVNPESGGYPEDILWESGSRVSIATGDFWPGSIVVFDGSISIAGEVAGHVIAIGTDVTVREAATVRGMVIVIGGILRQRGDGKIYGDIFAPGGHRRSRLTISRAWEFEEEGFGWRPQVSYDRVDGFRPGVETRLNGGPYQPQLRVSGAFALASETWQYLFEVRQRLSRRWDVELAGRYFRRTETDDDPWVGRDENTVFAVVTGSDYRDYYGADGGEIEVIYKYRERGILKGVYRNTDYRWLCAGTNLWHIFRPDHDFRENFSTATTVGAVPGRGSDSFAGFVDHFEQRTSAVILNLVVEPLETARHAVGFNRELNVTYEVAGGGLGGDFDYDRVLFRGRGWWDTGRWHSLSLRLFYGAGRRDLPPNRIFYLGGIGSLRGYSQKSFVGNEAMLATVEYRLNYWTNEYFDGGVIVFFDGGRATFANDFWDLGKFKTDIGLGLGIDDWLRLDVAKGLDHSDRDMKVTLRLSTTR